MPDNQEPSCGYDGEDAPGLADLLAGGAAAAAWLSIPWLGVLPALSTIAASVAMCVIAEGREKAQFPVPLPKPEPAKRGRRPDKGPLLDVRITVRNKKG